MKIVFDVTSCAKARRGGIGNYGRELIQACARVAPANDYRLGLRLNRWAKRHLVGDILPGVSPRPLIDGLDPLLWGSSPDIFMGIGVRLPARFPCPRAVMIHDVNTFEFPELSSEKWAAVRQAKIRETVARAELSLTPSAQGARVLHEHVGVPLHRIRVVPEGFDPEIFRPPAADVLQTTLTKHGLDGRPYIMTLGGIGPRKNQLGLLRAFAKADIDREWMLLLAGSGKENPGFLEEAKLLGVDRSRIQFITWVEAEELPALLSGAGFYCCSSMHEGFGLPVIEAQACGTPVISSNRGALLETLGELGISFDPEDEDEFTAAIEKMAGDSALRAALAKRGIERVRAEYTWDRVAEKTLSVFAELC